MTIASDVGKEAVKWLVHAATATLEQHSKEVDDGFALISKAVLGGQTVFACGNGGSSATAAHFIAELVGRYKKERGPLRAVALGSCLSTITAVGNDYGYDQVFARELEGLGVAGDVLICFTTSGRSPNVLKAIDVARERGIGVIAVTGTLGADLALITDCTIPVVSPVTARIQEVHDLIIHIWCEALDTLL
ncbi:MAG: gmhA [Parcubacteria group bacterium]|nr:gmhA [Parcubacteria group bacterium]